VIVATQMLESMIDSPVPTRAEASDVATAVYDGADAVMLSAESATGKHPVGAVDVMDRIIRQVESDPLQRQLVDASHVAASPSGDVADAVCCAVRRTVSLLQAKAIVSYTSSGHTSLRVARERLESPILSLTPNIETARRLTLAWGVHSVHIQEVSSVEEMTDLACASTRSEGFAEAGQTMCESKVLSKRTQSLLLKKQASLSCKSLATQQLSSKSKPDWRFAKNIQQ
jgi:pyruvate kinase